MKKIFSYLILAMIGLSMFSFTNANFENTVKPSWVENFSLWFDARDYLDATDACSSKPLPAGKVKETKPCQSSFYDSLNNLFNFAILIVFFILVAKILIKLSWGWEDKGWMGWMGMMWGWGEDMFSFKKLMAKIGIEVWALVILFALAFWIIADIKVFVWYVKETFNSAVEVDSPTTDSTDWTLKENAKTEDKTKPREESVMDLVPEEKVVE